MGRFIREELAREGVDVRGVVTDPERLTALVILGIRDQESFPLIFYRENCADMALDEDDIEDLLLNPELIRNRAKIEAVIHNARVCEDWAIADWQMLVTEAQVPAPAGPPLRSLDLPDSTPESRRLSGLFRERGFKLIGPVTAHRWLQRTALAPGHVRGCFRANPTGPAPHPAPAG